MKFQEVWNDKEEISPHRRYHEPSGDPCYEKLVKEREGKTPRQVEGGKHSR